MSRRAERKVRHQPRPPMPTVTGFFNVRSSATRYAVTLPMLDSARRQMALPMEVGA